MRTSYYSPHPPAAYVREDKDGKFGIGLEFVDERFAEWWNLYWLSEPSVDALLLPLDEWVASKPLHPELPTVTADALYQQLGGVPLQVLLSRPADVFVQRLRASPHTHLAPYKLLGAAWVDTVVARGLAKVVPLPEVIIARPTYVVEGNLVRVNFRKGGPDN